MSFVVAIVGLALMGATLWFGRRDLTRPAVAFGAVWFFFVALAQLRLTSFEHPWSASFAALVIGGGLIFMAAATLAGGTIPARSAVAPKRADYRARPLLIAALTLMIGAGVGWWYKSRVLGGIPLFSGNIDRARALAEGGAGNGRLPAWSSFLTDGFALGAWCLLALLWSQAGRLRRSQRLAVGLLVVMAFVGTAFDGSRNIVTYAVAIPLIAAYVASRPEHRRGRALRLVGAVAIVVGISGAFLVRSSQSASSASGFVRAGDARVPPAARPLLPLYIAGALSLEAERRLWVEVGDGRPLDRGGASLASLPSAFFPAGKPNYADDVGALMHDRPSDPYWTVATYQGRALVDWGAAGVLAASAAMGLLLGCAYRAGRSRRGLLGLGLVAVSAYYAAFMFYDNLLSFSVIAIYDLAVIAAVDFLARAPTAQLDVGRLLVRRDAA